MQFDEFRIPRRQSVVGAGLAVAGAVLAAGTTYVRRPAATPTTTEAAPASPAPPWAAAVNDIPKTSDVPVGSGVIIGTSVEDYGAKGYGYTDDTTAFQRAIAAAAGGTVLVPKGVYTINDSLSVGFDNARFLGEGYSSVIKAGNSFPDSTPMIHVTGPGGSLFRWGAVVEQLCIDGSRREVTGVRLDSSYHAQLHHCWIRGCLRTGLDLNGTQQAFGAYTHVTSCQITDGGRGVTTNFHEHGIFTGCLFAWHNQPGGVGVESWSSNMVFQGCKFDVNTVSLDLEFCHANVISACDFDRASTNHLLMNGATQSRVVANQFSNRTSGASGHDMIAVMNSGNASNIFIANVALPGSGWTNFVHEFSGTGPGNQYIGNDQADLDNVLLSPWLSASAAGWRSNCAVQRPR